MERSSGILMSISSLPSAYGIGTLGKAAYDFADFLHAAGQKYWQMLPLGPISYGDSPYQSFSSFAGNPYYIDLDMLIKDGLLDQKDISDIDFGTDPRYVDYGKIYENRFKILAIAKKNGWTRDLKKVEEWISDNQWVKEYALYMSCKKYFGMKSWMEWPDEDLRFRDPQALKKYGEMLKDDIEFYTYIQFLFFRQWDALKKYLHTLKIETIGDIPIYAALDSADVWSEPQFFQLDEEYIPKDVAGVPPDYFSADGQLWGNPLYDWKAMKEDGYGWWIRRIGGISKMFDMVRIDHFRGFSEYWAIPYGDTTAKNGRWMKGPAMDLVGRLAGWFPDTKFIAEDLGTPTASLKKLLKESGWPGMKVLEFAFDAKGESDYLPHAFQNHCICYTGTHDNATLLEWLGDTPEKDIAFAVKYLGLKDKDNLADAVMRAGHRSAADLFIAQMQDYLGLGKGHRMNIPSTIGGNWIWRILPEEMTEKLAADIKEMTVMYGRCKIEKSILPEGAKAEAIAETEIEAASQDRA